MPLALTVQPCFSDHVNCIHFGKQGHPAGHTHELVLSPPGYRKPDIHNQNIVWEVTLILFPSNEWASNLCWSANADSESERNILNVCEKGKTEHKEGSKAESDDDRYWSIEVDRDRSGGNSASQMKLRTSWKIDGIKITVYIYLVSSWSISKQVTTYFKTTPTQVKTQKLPLGLMQRNCCLGAADFSLRGLWAEPKYSSGLTIHNVFSHSF